MTSPKVDDPVTILVWRDARQVVVRATVMYPGGVTADGSRVLMQAKAISQSYYAAVPYSLDDEGLTWARGHTGPAVEALHAALALT